MKMNKRVKKTLTAVAVVLLSSCQPAPQSFLPEYLTIDLLIENGNVLDGLGNDAVASDVVVVGDKIVFVGRSKYLYF